MAGLVMAALSALGLRISIGHNNNDDNEAETERTIGNQSMRTVGVVGGLSWVSTAHYYEAINRAASASLGGTHSAQVVVFSVDFGVIDQAQLAGDFHIVDAVLGSAATSLEAAGVDGIFIASNTAHMALPAVQDAVSVPVFHIADATAAAVLAAGCTNVALLGTRFVMEGMFFVDRLREALAPSCDIVTPTAVERQDIHEIIFSELVLKTVNPKSRRKVNAMVHRMMEDHGCDGVILACTELSLLVNAETIGAAGAGLHIFDSASIHAQAAANFMLGIDDVDQVGGGASSSTTAVKKG